MTSLAIRTAAERADRDGRNDRTLRCPGTNAAWDRFMDRIDAEWAEAMLARADMAANWPGVRK